MLGKSKFLQFLQIDIIFPLPVILMTISSTVRKNLFFSRFFTGVLQRKVDEIARLSETRRKEQERNFRLVSIFSFQVSLLNIYVAEGNQE